MKPRQTPLLNFLVLSLGIVGTAGTLFLDSAHAGNSTWQGTGTNLHTSGNWTAGLPTASGDTATWNGTHTGNLQLTWLTAFGSANNGTSINITNTQTGSLRLASSSANAGNTDQFALRDITIANGAGAFTLGDSIGNDGIVFRNAGSPGPYINTFTNHDDNTATFASNLFFASGGGQWRTLVFAGSGNWTVNAPLTIVSGGSGNFYLTKNDAGTLTLNAVNGYTATTTVNGGLLSITSSGGLASGNALTIGASGKADFANAGQTLGAVDNANTTANALNFSASTGTITLASLAGAGNTRFGSNGTVTGGISTGTVNAVGLLTASISGGTVAASSLSSTAVSGGAATVSGVATIATMSAGTANLNGATSAITTLNGGTVNLGSSTVLTVNDGTTSGSITGSGGSLTKSGAGTLTLASGGTYNYNGATSVTDGKLIVNGNISTSTTTVSGTGTLGGGGTVGSVIVQAGGTFAPGNSIDNFDIAGALTLGTSSFSVFEINTAGDISDLAIVSGLLTFGGTLNVNNVGSTLVNGDTFDLFNWGSKSGTFSAVNLPVLDSGLTWDDTALYTNGTITVVPEPHAALLGGLGLLALLRRRR